jgi:DNA-directed RNA polymerase subunit F
MFELKRLNKEAIPAALEKAKQYRLLNEPSASQSICLDILEVEPENQDALVTIVLAMSDRFSRDYSIGDSQIQTYLAKISDEHQRAYYTGIIYERRAKAILKKNVKGTEATIFELFRQAMEWFERAEAASSTKNDNAVLRWNECARIIDSNKLAPQEKIHGFDFIE